MEITDEEQELTDYAYDRLSLIVPWRILDKLVIQVQYVESEKLRTANGYISKHGKRLVFVICIRKRNDSKSKEIICHECIHIAQIVSGILENKKVFGGNQEDSIWRGDNYGPKDLYENPPWEIEAEVLAPQLKNLKHASRSYWYTSKSKKILSKWSWNQRLD